MDDSRASLNGPIGSESRTDDDGSQILQKVSFCDDDDEKEDGDSNSSAESSSESSSELLSDLGVTRGSMSSTQSTAAEAGTSNCTVALEGKDGNSHDVESAAVQQNLSFEFGSSVVPAAVIRRTKDNDESFDEVSL
jgi:hypothetical protein